MTALEKAWADVRLDCRAVQYALQVEDALRSYLERMMPREVDAKADGKYESVVYVPFGKGSRSGKGENWKRDESTASLHALRKDAKARALRLYREWLEAQS